MSEAFQRLDRTRRFAGFLGVEETLALAGDGVTVLDPVSTLISPEAVLGPGVILWPSVVVQVAGGGSVEIGAGTVLLPGTRIVAIGGTVSIGVRVEIGDEGGFTIKAEAAGGLVEIGDEARLMGNGTVAADTRIGSGAQVIGPIRVQQCRLGGGGSYREPDADLRGGVLKGCGVARGLEVPCGRVIQAFGLFAEAPLRRQVEFHPREDRLAAPVPQVYLPSDPSAQPGEDRP